MVTSLFGRPTLPRMQDFIDLLLRQCMQQPGVPTAAQLTPGACDDPADMRLMPCHRDAF